MKETILYTDWEKVTWHLDSVGLPCEKNGTVTLKRDGPTLLWGKRVLRFDAAVAHEHTRYGDNGDDESVRLHLIHESKLVVIFHGFTGQIHDDPIPGESAEVLARQRSHMDTARRIISLLGLGS